MEIDITNISFEELVDLVPTMVRTKINELAEMRERPDYHPEESAREHIKIVTERLMQTGNPDLILAGLFHDICKLDTMKINPKTGYPTSPGHEGAAVKFIKSNLIIQMFIEDAGSDVDKVCHIVQNHMKFHQLGNMRPTKKDKYIKEWSDTGFWKDLQVMGAADNMLVEFDLNNLSASWKTL